MSLVDVYNSGYEMILAQPVTFAPTIDNSEKVAFNFPNEWVQFGKFISIIFVGWWLYTVVFAFANPKNRGSGWQRVGGLGPFCFGILAAVFFWDINATVKWVNILISAGLSGLSALTGLFGS